MSLSSLELKSMIELIDRILIYNLCELWRHLNVIKWVSDSNPILRMDTLIIYIAENLSGYYYKS